MAIVYCDWATGNDSTGDGSAGNPYKTIDKASTGLTGGDEVRVAKGPARTAISVDLSWTNGSRTVTGAGDLTGEIARYAIIAKATAGPPGDPETVYEVGTISYDAGTDTTTITLGTHANHKYVGTTETCASVIINALDTGSATGQVVSAAGTGQLTRLTVSGGWTLGGTPAQDGETWFVQRNVTPAAKEGRGLSWIDHRFLLVSDMGFLRYAKGLDSGNGRQELVQRCTLSCGTSAITEAYSGWMLSQFESCISSGQTGGFGSAGRGFKAVGCNCYGCSGNAYGMSNAACKLCLCTAKYCAIGIRLDNGLVDTVGMVFEGNSTDLSIVSPRTMECRCIMGHHNWGGVAGTHWAGSELAGKCERDTSDYRGESGESIKVTPISATFAAELAGYDDWFIANATSGENLTLKIYAKAGATWNGKCWLQGYINGVSVSGPTEKTLTTDWAEYSIVIPSTSVTETGPIAALRVLVTGTVGVVNFDDFSWSSAAP